MPRTRVFKSGDGQAVRIPPELAYADTSIELEINRFGDVITIAPVPHTMADVIASLRRMPKPRNVEKRRAIEVPIRKP